MYIITVFIVDGFSALDVMIDYDTYLPMLCALLPISIEELQHSATGDGVLVPHAFGEIGACFHR